MNEGRYGYEVALRGVAFDDAVARVTEALKKEGFGVLTEIDVGATLKRKLGIDFRRYRILGACNPHLASRALEIDGQIGLLLPCNVVVQQDGGDVHVSVASPRIMNEVAEEPRLEPVVSEADERLRRALDAVG